MGRSNRRMAVVDRSALLTIADCAVRVLYLHFRWCNVFLARVILLMRVRPSVDATSTSVIADPIDRDVVDHLLVVDVGNMPSAKIIRITVVIKRATTPVPAVIARAVVSIAIIHTAVEAHTRCPITSVKNIKAIVPCPVTRRPQQANCGRPHPCAWHPVVISSVVFPISWRPQIAITRNRRLHIDW